MDRADLDRKFEAKYRDFSSLRSFGGDPENFIDGTQPTTRNTRRMIDAMLKNQSDRHPASRSAARHGPPQSANLLSTHIASTFD